MTAFDGDTLTDAQYQESVADFIGRNENNTGNYSAHHDGGDSIAIGYGLDLLENNNDTIKEYLRDSGIPELTLVQET